VSDLLSQCGDLSEDVIVQTTILAPLLLGDEWPSDEDSLAVPSVALLLLSLGLLLLLILFSMLQIRVELVDPFLVHS